MEAQCSPAHEGHGLAAHEELRARLRARYGLTGEFVGAPTVALILGLGRTTIHDQVRANRFVIPHRCANRKPLFLLDDLVAWMLGRDRPSGAVAEAPAAGAAARTADAAPMFKHPEAEEAFLKVCQRRGIAPPAARRQSRTGASGSH